VCLVRCKSGRAVGLSRLPTYAYALGIALALPACRRESPGGRQREPEAETPDASGAAVAVAPHVLAEPATGRSSFIVLLDAPDAALEATLASATIQKLRAGTVVAVERRAAADVSLPRTEALATVAATLADVERARVRTATQALLVDATVANPSSGRALRAALAMTAALVQAWPKAAPLVYDVDARRITSAEELLRQAREAEALTDPAALLRAQLFLHRYDDPAGTRLLTLNLRAFGLADLAIEGADPADAAALAPVLAGAAVAQYRAVAEGNATAPLRLGDVAVDLVRAPRQDDDPDNLVYRLVPAVAAGASGPIAPAARAHALFAVAAADEARPVSDDPAVLAASSRARSSFARAVRSWRASPGTTLEVEVAFHERDRADRAATEWMWMTVDTLDEPTHLRGRLLNEPALLKGLGAAFSPVENDGTELFDWRLLSPDGGVEGGETLRLLQKP
jgi:hypothetical protein